LTLVIKHSNC